MSDPGFAGEWQFYLAGIAPFTLNLRYNDGNDNREFTYLLYIGSTVRFSAKMLTVISF